MGEGRLSPSCSPNGSAILWSCLNFSKSSVNLPFISQITFQTKRKFTIAEIIHSKLLTPVIQELKFSFIQGVFLNIHSTIRNSMGAHNSCLMTKKVLSYCALCPLLPGLQWRRTSSIATPSSLEKNKEKRKKNRFHKQFASSNSGRQLVWPFIDPSFLTILLSNMLQHAAGIYHWLVP